eukprot:scaffold3.g6379.t1
MPAGVESRAQAAAQAAAASQAVAAPAHETPDVRARRLETEAKEMRGRAAEQELWEAERLLYLLPEDGGRDVDAALAKLLAMAARLEARMVASVGADPARPSARAVFSQTEPPPRQPWASKRPRGLAVRPPLPAGAGGGNSGLAALEPPLLMRRNVSAALEGAHLQPTEDPELPPLADAAFVLAALLASGAAAGHGLPPDDARAARLLHTAAQAGSTEAQLALAARYGAGRGAPRMTAEALYHARLVLADMLAMIEAKGNGGNQAAAHPSLRLAYIDGGYVPPGAAERDDEALLHWEHDLAARGNAAARRQLGYRMLVGQGMGVDHEGAMREFRAAAAEGDAYAAFNVGYMHIRGLGVPVNYTAAWPWFEAAGRKGVAAALNALGVIYFQGQVVGYQYQGGYGVPLNMSHALRLFRNATRLGSWHASHHLINVYHDGLYGVPRNPSAALKEFWTFMGMSRHWRESSKRAAADAARRDVWAAALRYALLAETGCPHAASNLAWMLHNGELHTEGWRHRVAQGLWERALGAGTSEPLLMLGLLHRRAHHYNLTTGTNLTAAAEYYRRAAERGQPEALFMLGQMSETGQGLPLNTSVAKEYYARAIRQGLEQQAAPRGAYAAAPWLTLQWLRLRLAALAVVRLARAPVPAPLAALARRPGTRVAPSEEERGSGGEVQLPEGLQKAAAWAEMQFVWLSAAAAKAQQRADRWAQRLPAGAPQWDTALLTALVGLLTAVLWLRQRRRGVAAAAAAAASEQQWQPGPVAAAEATAAARAAVPGAAAG